MTVQRGIILQNHRYYIQDRTRRIVDCWGTRLILEHATVPIIKPLTEQALHAELIRFLTGPRGGRGMAYR